MIFSGVMWQPFPPGMTGELFYFLFGVVLLWVSGIYLIRGGVALGRAAGLSPLVIGIVVISLGTSAPELLVSVRAAVTGHPDIAVGNVVGSNIANVGLVLGLTALFVPIMVPQGKFTVDSLVMVGVTVLFIVLSCTGERISRGEGMFMVFFIVVYLLYLLLQRPAGVEMPVKPGGWLGRWWFALLVVAASSLGLAVAADYVVLGASGLAVRMGVNERVVSLTMVALGTSLPELTASVTAIIKKEPEISVGNILGSNIFNLFGIIGVTALVRPLQVSREILRFDILYMLMIAIVLIVLGWIGRELSRRDGFILLLLYLLYLLLVFGFLGQADLPFHIFHRTFCS